MILFGKVRRLCIDLAGSAACFLMTLFYLPVVSGQMDNDLAHPVAGVTAAACAEFEFFVPGDGDIIAQYFGFDSADDMKDSVRNHNVSSLSRASEKGMDFFWRRLLLPKTHAVCQQERASLRWQWSQELIKKSCANGPSDECVKISAGMLSYYLFTDEAETFIKLLQEVPVARGAFEYLHSSMLLIEPQEPVYQVRQSAIQHFLDDAQLPGIRQSCHFSSHFNPDNPLVKLFLSSSHQNEILNFIWFGPNLPMRYVENLWSWADAYPDMTVVLWFAETNLSKADKEAYTKLQLSRPNLLVTDITNAGLENITGTGINAAGLVERMLTQEIDIPDGRRYAAASDFARVALVAKGGDAITQALSLPEPYDRSMIYMDLDVSFTQTCGFSPLQQSASDLFIHLYNARQIVSADILAAKRSNNPVILKLLNSLYEYQNREMDSDHLIPIPFDTFKKEILADGEDLGKKRFPLLWDTMNSDQSWKAPDKSLFARTWKEVCSAPTEADEGCDEEVSSDGSF